MLLNRALAASLALLVFLVASVPAAALPPPLVEAEVVDDGAAEAESPLNEVISETDVEEHVVVDDVAVEGVVVEDVGSDDVAVDDVAVADVGIDGITQTEEASAIDEATAIEAVPIEAPPVVELAPSQPVERARPKSPVLKPPELASPEPEPAIVASTPESPKKAQPKETMHELAIEIGWNAPAGWGFRYLFRIPKTPVSVGLGAGLLTLWGPKVSVLARWSPKVESGPFFQGSFAMSGGSRGEVDVPVPLEGGGVSMEKASLVFTPGRTLDFVGGWRWAFGNGFLDLFGGYSVKLGGVALQDRTQTMVELDETTRFALDLMSPGGISWGATWGWRF